MGNERTSEGVASRARTALGWRALNQFSNQGIRIVVSIVMARLLMPDDFGIVGMAAIVTGLANVFRDFGFGQALVQRPELEEKHSKSAFWATFVMAGLLCGGIYYLAPLAGSYFQDDRMVPVLRVMALSFLVTPFTVVPRSLLQRDLDFKRPFLADLSGNITYGVVGVTTVVLGQEYWALVWALLSSRVMASIVLCALMRYVPPLIPTLHGARDLLGFGAGITGSHLVGNLANRADFLIVGRLMTASTLGLYERAFKVARMPVDIASRIANQVAFSAFSRVQHDMDRLRKAHGRLTSSVATLTWPAIAVMIVSAPEAIPLILGEQWSEAVRPVQVLGFATMLMGIGYSASSTFKAVGRVDLNLYVQILVLLLVSAGSFVGARYNLVAVSLGILAAYAIITIVVIIFIRVGVDFGFKRYIIALGAPSALTVTCLLAAYGTRRAALAGELPAWALLTLTVVAGMSVAAALISLAPTREMKANREELLKFWDVAARGLRRLRENRA
jgi:PST family polysaccharide transporter